MNYMFLPFRRYFDFRGRSRRKEYWLYTLFVFVTNILLSLVDLTLGLVGGFGISSLFGLVTFIPGLAVTVRRLHDTDRSGWWLLALLAPALLAFLVLGAGLAGSAAGNFALAGAGVLGGILALAVLGVGIAILVFMCLDGTPGPNRFGPDPKNPDNLAEVFA